MLAMDSSDSPGGLVGLRVSVVAVVDFDKAGGFEVKVLDEVGVSDGA